MKHLLSLILCIILYNTAKSQETGNNFISHITVGFEIGQNYLDVDNLNRDIENIGLSPLNPDIGNFAFQLGLGHNDRVESYFTLAILYSNVYSDSIGSLGLPFSSSLRGTYFGAGVRFSLLKLFKERLILSIPLEFNKAYYFIELMEAYQQPAPAHYLVDNSRVLLARHENFVLQPSLQLMYQVLRRKNSLNVGFKVGYLFHLSDNDWTNRKGAQISDLSSIGNSGNLNISLKFAYTIQSTGRN